MDHHLKEFYHQSSGDTPRSNFHSVIPLHLSQDIDWEELKEKIPSLMRGWYELAHLSAADRIEFTKDYWLSKLPYRQGLDESLGKFFSALDDIGVYITQKKFDDPYVAHLVYSIKGDGGFFCGGAPVTERGLMDLKDFFQNEILPKDYLAFLQVHNGFCKTTDSTGIIKTEDVPQTYLDLQRMQGEPIMTTQGTFINPKSLIPFYESFGMPFYQCFCAEWYPEDEMGNVYYSREAKTISDIYTGTSSIETMAFPTFTDWLLFYLEKLV